ncbi:hypothetical protein DSUL_150029 [Desulfovibrionales bacterium]
MALSKGYSFWMLSSALPCGARTFLPGPQRPAAMVHPTPH